MAFLGHDLIMRIAIVPTRAERWEAPRAMPEEVSGGLAAAVLLSDSALAWARWARHLDWSAVLEGPAEAALCCNFIPTDEGADFWGFAQEVLGPALL